MVDYRKIGERIRMYRIRKGLTQEELSFMIETAPSYISSIESGKKKPSLRKLADMAEAMELTVNDFLYDMDEMNIDSLNRLLAMFPREKQEHIIQYFIKFVKLIIN